MRSRFDEQLAVLHRELITMGALCENAIAMSTKALNEGDVTLAGEVFDYSTQIDQKERDIEAMCMRLLLQQQPVAKDLRYPPRSRWSRTWSESATTPATSRRSSQCSTSRQPTTN